MRLFFAITLPDDTRELVSDVQAALRSQVGREGVRWEDSAKFHITVRFLGEVSEGVLPAVMEAGRRAAEAVAPFELELEGLGTFPERRAPRVLWIGVKKGLPQYARFVEYLDGALMREPDKLGEALSTPNSDGAEQSEPRRPGEPRVKLHLREVGRRASPHVTLARVKSESGAKAVSRIFSEKIAKKADKKGVFFVYNVVLIESELRPEGSVFTVLETFQLAGIEAS